jgi:genome maintenance exonuclease 1
MKKTMNLVQNEHLTTCEKNGKRWYYVHNGETYPSVTTVLDTRKSQTLEEWRKRVGPEEAARISNSAKIRGTNIHEAVEHYLTFDKYPSNILPTTQAIINKLRPTLDNDIDNIRMMEGCLWSDTMRLAGRTDVISDYKGTLSVIDFKGSNRPKKEEHIDNYFMQATAYAIMFEERYGVPVEQIVIVVAVDQQFEKPQIFVKQTKKYVDMLMECVHNYHAKVEEENKKWDGLVWTP